MVPFQDIVGILSIRENFRNSYWKTKDPILADRLSWRAQTFRHLIHLLPGETILELGSGNGEFTTALKTVTRGKNPITSVNFSKNNAEALQALKGQQFNFVVSMDLIDQRVCGKLMQEIYELLTPGGQVVFYETNPWNPILNTRKAISNLFGRSDPRFLMNRTQLYELISEVGFIRVFAVYNDFMYAPLSRWMISGLKYLSSLFENLPILKLFSGSILLHAQKPPRIIERSRPTLAEFQSLFGSVSFVVPCHNEEMNIEPLVNGIEEFYGPYVHEIILVDDNSKDRTKLVIQELRVKNPKIKPVFRNPPNGVGRAISDGLKAATGKYVLSLDCDFQHLLPEFHDIFQAADQGADVVVGSRFSPSSVLLNYPYQKILANRGFNFLSQFLLLRRFRDVTNNLKLMKREVVESLKLKQVGFAVNAETGLQPLLAGFKVVEVPISWINRTPDMGSSSFKLAKVGGGYIRVLIELWKFRFFNKGMYRGLKRKN